LKITSDLKIDHDGKSRRVMCNRFKIDFRVSVGTWQANPWTYIVIIKTSIGV